MRREWKPGQVLTEDTGERFFVVERWDKTPASWGPGAQAIGPDGTRWRVDTIPGARPLLVIDPEDREAVERLAAAYVRTWVSGDLGAGIIRIAANQMQAALREYADPPPKEPTGRFAEVINSEGMTYYRAPSGTWHRASDNLERPWSQIGVVRVISEGADQ